MKKNKHIGVYGIAQSGKKILFVKKSRGPYKGLYDLPGGGIEFGEDLTSALHREFDEEVGGNIQINPLLGVFDYNSLWLDDGIEIHTHHIGIYFSVNYLSKEIKSDSDGHDSDGAEWLDFSSVTPSQFAPIAYRAIKGL